MDAVFDTVADVPEDVSQGPRSSDWGHAGLLHIIAQLG